ncbi:MAG: hypothetical protein JSU58_09550 [Dehalococcoidales bacterium]|nr:MAG: hypothetical protein JSU58_09550 [Dehalococcoidales bacterium]
MNYTHEKRNRNLETDFLDESVIRRKTVIETFQQPLTLILLIVTLASILYLILLSPMFGGGVVALILSLISGLAAVSSFIGTYMRIYPAIMRQVITDREKERKESEENESDRLHENLRFEFQSIAHNDGLAILTSLTTHYKQLSTTVSGRNYRDPLGVSLVPALAGEVYRQGLIVLWDTVEFINVAELSDKKKLYQEIAQLEKEINTSERKKLESEQVELKEEILASHRERLEMLNQLDLRIEQLLHQARRCDAILEATHIEITTSRISGSRKGVDSMIKALQTTIRQVKEVQDELDKLIL